MVECNKRYEEDDFSHEAMENAVSEADSRYWESKREDSINLGNFGIYGFLVDSDTESRRNNLVSRYGELESSDLSISDMRSHLEKSGYFMISLSYSGNNLSENIRFKFIEANKKSAFSDDEIRVFYDHEMKRANGESSDLVDIDVMDRYEGIVFCPNDAPGALERIVVCDDFQDKVDEGCIDYTNRSEVEDDNPDGDGLGGTAWEEMGYER